MLSREKKEAMQKAQAGSKIMADNVKVSTDDLVGKVLTISDYDKIGADGVDETTGEETHHYFAVTFEELPGNYVLSGSALTKLIDSAEEDNEDIRGEKIRVDKKTKIKNGRYYTPVVLL
jgi:hypothetical protein